MHSLTDTCMQPEPSTLNSFMVLGFWTGAHFVPPGGFTDPARLRIKFFYSGAKEQATSVIVNLQTRPAAPKGG